MYWHFSYVTLTFDVSKSPTVCCAISLSQFTRNSKTQLFINEFYILSILWHFKSQSCFIDILTITSVPHESTEYFKDGATLAIL